MSSKLHKHVSLCLKPALLFPRAKKDRKIILLSLGKMGDGRKKIETFVRVFFSGKRPKGNGLRSARYQFRIFLTVVQREGGRKRKKFMA